MSDSIEFTYNESYPIKAKKPSFFGPTCTFSSMDLVYLQDHIRTYRAVRTTDIDGAKGKYYDAAITMLDAFSIFMQAGYDNITPVECKIIILPDTITEVSFELEVIDNLVYDQSMDIEIKSHRAIFRMQYQNNNCAEDIPGCYTVEMTNLQSGVRITVGDAQYSKVVEHVMRGTEDDLCFVANRDALRYCECFPSPCIFKMMCTAAWAKIN